MKQFVTEKPQDPVEVRVYGGADGSFSLYEDDGTSRDYVETSAYTKIKFVWDNDATTLTISNVKGSFAGMLKTRTFEIVLVQKGHGSGLKAETKPNRVITYIGAEMVVKLWCWLFVFVIIHVCMLNSKTSNVVTNNKL